MQTGSANIQTARIICAALMGGVVLFWVVAFVISAGEGLGADLPLDPTVLLALVIAVSVGAFGVALAMKSKAAAPQAEASSVLTKLITAWALLEGQAFLAGVLFMLSGNASLLIIPALVFVAGFAMTFPKPEWFAEPSQTARP